MSRSTTFTSLAFERAGHNGNSVDGDGAAMVVACDRLPQGETEHNDASLGEDGATTVIIRGRFFHGRIRGPPTEFFGCKYSFMDLILNAHN